MLLKFWKAEWDSWGYTYNGRLKETTSLLEDTRSALSAWGTAVQASESQAREHSPADCCKCKVFNCLQLIDTPGEGHRLYWNTWALCIRFYTAVTKEDKKIQEETLPRKADMFADFFSVHLDKLFSFLVKLLDQSIKSVHLLFLPHLMKLFSVDN